MSWRLQRRQGLQPELALHVRRVVEQDTAVQGGGRARPGRLLDVVLQGAGDVQVHHQAHVLLVHPHAEGVGGADDAQLAGDEGVLDAALLRGP